jgi:signal peptidase I
MNLHSNSNSPYISQGGTLSFSNLGQLEILLAMVERDASLRSTARGYSMYPFIRDKDVLTISPLRGRQLKAGDVVAFTQNNTGRLAIHRIIEKKESGWLIRGDNCFEPDGVIPDEKVIGIVTRVERAGRDIRLAIGKAAGVVAFLNRNSALQSLKQIWMMPRLIASRLLAFAQSLSLYRALACRIVPPLDIGEANEDDMEAVHDAFNPFSPYRREKPNPNVLNLGPGQRAISGDSFSWSITPLITPLAGLLAFFTPGMATLSGHGHGQPPDKARHRRGEDAGCRGAVSGCQ